MFWICVLGEGRKNMPFKYDKKKKFWPFFHFVFWNLSPEVHILQTFRKVKDFMDKYLSMNKEVQSSLFGHLTEVESVGPDMDEAVEGD